MITSITKVIQLIIIYLLIISIVIPSNSIENTETLTLGNNTYNEMITEYILVIASNLDINSSYRIVLNTYTDNYMELKPNSTIAGKYFNIAEINLKYGIHTFHLLRAEYRPQLTHIFWNRVDSISFELIENKCVLLNSPDIIIFQIPFFITFFIVITCIVISIVVEIRYKLNKSKLEKN